MNPAITFSGVSKRFVLHHQRSHSFQEALVNLVHRRNSSSEEFWAVHDVSFEVEAGETFGIIGQNGSGKSTVFKLIGRILEPSTGRIIINGKVSALIELGAGFHPDLTGRENIYLNGSILGLSHKQINHKFNEIVAFSELERFIDTPIKHYSSGMYMRLGFAVAIHVDPSILLIDEVLAVGDAAFQERCLQTIRRFKDEGKTILMVSHDLEMVRRFCDRAMLLSQGEMIDCGAVDRVINRYLDLLSRTHHRADQAAV